MTSVKSWVMAALFALALCSTAMGQAREAEADPSVWGVYARLVGTGWQGKFGTRTTRWGQGGQIIEDDSTFGQSVITPGPTPGTLSLELGSSKLHTFQGTIASDGSVLWIRDGMIKMPYRVLLRDGELVEEAVKLNGREVASVKRDMRYQQVNGPRLASRPTPGPKAEPTFTPPAASVSTANADAAVSTAPVTAAAALAPHVPANLPESGQVQDGRVNAPILRPSVANFGPYAGLEGLAYIGPDGTYVLWYLSPSGNTMVSETRRADGTLDNIHVIKPTTPGNLLMLRTGYCPDEVCGQTGVVTEKVVTWREPKSIGGRAGEMMEVRMWLESAGVLVVQTTNLNPAGGGPPMVLEPYGLKLVQPPQRSAEIVTQSAGLVANLESRIEVDVAQALGKQLATRQAQDDAMEARRRSSARVQSFNRLMGSVNSALAEVDTGGYAEAQANLDATVANIQHAAAVERQQQALAQQQAQARAAEENRQKLAENARWVAEKEQAAAEYRSGQVDAAAAREAQLLAQQQADQQRRASASAQSRRAELERADEKIKTNPLDFANSATGTISSAINVETASNNKKPTERLGEAGGGETPVSGKPTAGKLFRGFNGTSCEHARHVATSKGTFVETAHEIQRSGSCIVQGWWTPNLNAAPRQ